MPACFHGINAGVGARSLNPDSAIVVMCGLRQVIQPVSQFPYNKIRIIMLFSFTGMFSS